MAVAQVERFLGSRFVAAPPVALEEELVAPVEVEEELQASRWAEAALVCDED